MSLILLIALSSAPMMYPFDWFGLRLGSEPYELGYLRGSHPKPIAAVTSDSINQESSLGFMRSQRARVHEPGCATCEVPERADARRAFANNRRVPRFGFGSDSRRLEAPGWF